jgi:hypothetical protein
MSLLQSILALLGTIAGIVAVVINRRYDAALQRETDIAQARRELSAAIAARHFDDAAFWARRLRELSALPVPPAPPSTSARLSIFLLLAFLLLPGCITPAPPQQPLIIGQRVLTPEPGQVLVIPPLTPPASTWYLVDDIGLGIWLGISPPATNQSAPASAAQPALTP